MAAPVVYRVPRRFITFPEDPPPYGFLAVSCLAHMACFGAALGLSAYLGSRMDQSKVYIVNLVPATPSFGSPAADPPAPTVRAPESPRPAPPAPKAEEKAPPKAARPEPPRPERPPERVVEPPPPRALEVAAARPKTLEPSELALPRRAEKENPALLPPAPRAIERSLPPPPPVTPPVAAPAPPASPLKLPEPPRIATPPAVPRAPAGPAPNPLASRPAAETTRPGNPTVGPAVSGSNVAVDTSNFPFTYYIRQLAAKVEDRWRRPPLVTPNRAVLIHLEIDRDGQLRGEPRIKQSSGNELYDQSAVRAVVEAAPFPPLPREFGERYLIVTYEFLPGVDRG